MARENERYYVIIAALIMAGERGLKKRTIADMIGCKDTGIDQYLDTIGQMVLLCEDGKTISILPEAIERYEDGESIFV